MLRVARYGDHLYGYLVWPCVVHVDGFDHWHAYWTTNGSREKNKQLENRMYKNTNRIAETKTQKDPQILGIKREYDSTV